MNDDRLERVARRELGAVLALQMLAESCATGEATGADVAVVSSLLVMRSLVATARGALFKAKKRKLEDDRGDERTAAKTHVDEPSIAPIALVGLLSVVDPLVDLECRFLKGRKDFQVSKEARTRGGETGTYLDE